VKEKMNRSSNAYHWRRFLSFPFYEFERRNPERDHSNEEPIYNYSYIIENEPAAGATASTTTSSITLATVLLLSCFAALLILAIKTLRDERNQRKEQNLRESKKVETFSEASDKSISILF
jgi:hypothetical protein